MKSRCAYAKCWRQTKGQPSTLDTPSTIVVAVLQCSLTVYSSNLFHLFPYVLLMFWMSRTSECLWNGVHYRHSMIWYKSTPHSPRQSPIYIILTSPAPPFLTPRPRPPQRPNPKQRPPTNRMLPIRQPPIRLHVSGRRSHPNDDQKDVIEAEESGGYQEAGCGIWYRRGRVPRRE